MSHVSVIPDFMTAAAADLATIGSAIDQAHRAAGPSILTIAPAAADDVSGVIAQLFSEHAQDYQAAAQGAAAFQEDFVQNLLASTGLYTNVDSAIASLLRVFGFEWQYYKTAGNALGNIILSYPMAQLSTIAIPLFWPFAPLAPLLALQQLLTLFTEVIAGQPISYPYTESPWVTLAIYKAMFESAFFGIPPPESIG